MTVLRLLPLLCCGFFVLAVLAPSLPAFAQDEKSVQEQDEELQETIRAHNEERSRKLQAAVDKGIAEREAKDPAYRVRRKVSKFTESLDETSQDHFYSIYGGHNLIEAVKITRSNITESVDACREANPEMKDEIDARFNTWLDSIKAPLDNAKGHIGNMIIAQDYAKSREIKDILKDVDSIRKEAENRYARIPVSTPEGCAFMLDKMDETQEQLVSILADIVKPPSQDNHN